MKYTNKWISIERLKPPKNIKVLASGKSVFNSKKKSIRYGNVVNENNVWKLICEDGNIEGLYDVEYWQHLRLPK